jgi:antitoxin component of MazEF toxin-antitoxin module
MNTPRMKEAWERSSRTADGLYSSATPMSVYARSCYEEGCKLENELTAVTEQRDEARGQRDELQQWKNDQMTVNSGWDMQTVGELLGLRIGEAITLNIEPKIRELINQRDRLAEALEECKEDSIELLGERNWWKDEHRSDYKKRYEETSENITRADKILAIVKGVSNE